MITCAFKGNCVHSTDFKTHITLGECKADISHQLLFADDAILYISIIESIGLFGLCDASWNDS